MSRHLPVAVVVLAFAAACSNGPSHAIDPRGDRGPSAAPPPIAACPMPGDAGVSGHTTAFGSVNLPCLVAGPPLDLTTLGGQRPVLVNLWASWCLPCKQEMPRLEQAYRSHGDRLLFLGVDTLDNPASGRSFLSKVHATYTELLDEEGAVRTHVKSVGLPVTIVIRNDGTIAYRRLGEMRPADIAAALAAVDLS